MNDYDEDEDEERGGYLPSVEEMASLPDVPRWWWDLCQDIGLADHLGDVWDSVKFYPPEQWKKAATMVWEIRFDD